MVTILLTCFFSTPLNITILNLGCLKVDILIGDMGKRMALVRFCSMAFYKANADEVKRDPVR